MKNILILLDYYLPNASPNGVCIANISEVLKQNGNNVHILCFNRENNYHKNDKNNNISVHYCDDCSTKTYRLLSYIKWISPFFKYPFYALKPRINSMYQVAENIIKSEKIDTVICVHLPIETLIVGDKLKKTYNKLTYYAYMLDSLSAGFLPRYLPEKLCRYRKLKWENNLFNNFDRIILMESSRKHHEMYCTKKTWYKNCIYLDIPMLIESRGSLKRSENSGKIKLLYVGSIVENVRNPQSIINALEVIDNNNLICEFIGQINCKEKFNKLKSIYGDRLIFTDFLPHSSIADKISQADILLNIGNSINTMVPSKIFEYMSFVKPIITTFEIEDEPSKKYLEHYPSVLLINGTDDAQINAKKIEGFICTVQSKPISIEFLKLKKLFYKNTPKAFVDNLCICDSR